MYISKFRIYHSLFFTILLNLLISFAHADPLNNHHLVNGCRVMDKIGLHVTTFPGNMCLFNPDGSFISANAQGLQKFGKNDETLWILPGHFHHQINFSIGQKYILALQSEIIPWEGEKLRLDKFLIVDQGGKIIYQKRAKELFDQVGIKLHRFETEPALLAAVGAKSESSHFNSFHEIPFNVQMKDTGKFPGGEIRCKQPYERSFFSLRGSSDSDPAPSA